MSECPAGEESCPGRAQGDQSPHLSAREWLLLLILAAVQFTHIVDFMIVMPLGPVYQEEMGLSPQQFGLVVAAYTVSAGLASLLAARFLDRFDRKTALLFLYAGFTAGTLLCALAPDFLLLLAARTIAGAFGGVAAAVVLAIIGDAFPDSRRGTATGVVMTAFSVASIAGVPLGLLLAAQLDWHAPFAVLAGLGALVLVLAAVVLPPLRGHLGRPPRPGIDWTLLTDANHLRAFALMMGLVFVSFMIAPYLATFLKFNVGLSQDDLALMYLFGGLATLVTLTPVGRLSDRFGKLRVFRLLALAMIVPIALTTNLSAEVSLAAVLTLTTVYFIVASARMVPAMAMITASTTPQKRGSFMSLNAAVQHLASGLATAVGGALLTQPDGAPIAGFPLLGVLACGATILTVWLAARLRPAVGGDLAPDAFAGPGAAPTAPADATALAEDDVEQPAVDRVPVLGDS
jgi:predicted MFS family arabinose efflux permease